MNVFINVRPSRPEDEPDIRKLFQETEIERLCMWHWDETARQQLIDFQFEARQKHYAALDVDQKECIIEVNETFAGRFVVIQNAEEIRIADIALMPAFKGLGVGTAIIQSIQQEGSQSKRPVRLMVEKTNAAVEIYQKLGFQNLEDLTTHYLMEWNPSGPTSAKLYFDGGQKS